MTVRRRSLLIGAVWGVAAASAVLGVVLVASADNPTTGVRTNTSQPRVGDPGVEDLESDDGLPPAELEDGLLHATIDGKVQAAPIEDGAIVDQLGRDADGNCNEAGEAYGVARLDKGGPAQGASISLNRDTCEMVAHLDAEEGSGG